MRLVAIIAFPILILLAFYASLNVTATNGPIFANLSGLNNLFSRPGFNISETTLALVNQSSFQNASFPVLLPQISLPAGFIIAIILAMFFLVSMSVLLNLRRQNSTLIDGFDGESELQKERERVADILDLTISELRHGEEYRQTVLECYRKICEILESKTEIDGTSLTAREFEVIVSSRLKLETPYLSQITDVFEVARYSQLLISKSMAEAAIDCLSNLSSLLRETENVSTRV